MAYLSPHFITFAILSQSMTKKTVLIFDDDIELLELCTVILEKRGYNVKTNDNCVDIQQVLDTNRPDVILMDNWIPDIGGVEATRFIKKSSFSSVPVIFFSANNDVKGLAAAAGADAYITKPFNISELEDVIEKILKENSTTSN